MTLQEAMKIAKTECPGIKKYKITSSKRPELPPIYRDGICAWQVLFTTPEQLEERGGYDTIERVQEV